MQEIYKRDDFIIALKEIEIFTIGEKYMLQLLRAGHISFDQQKQSFFADVQSYSPLRFIQNCSFPDIDFILYPGVNLEKKRKITIKQGNRRKSVPCYPYYKADNNTFEILEEIKGKKVLLFTDVLKSGDCTKELYSFIKEKAAYPVGIYILFDRCLEIGRMIHEKFGHISNHVQAISTVYDLISVLKKIQNLAKSLEMNELFKLMDERIKIVEATLK